MRMPVAEDVGPPRTHRVEIALALEVFEPDAFRGLDRHERQPLVVLHLRAGVPDASEGAGGELCVLHIGDIETSVSVCGWPNFRLSIRRRGGIHARRWSPVRVRADAPVPRSA